MRLILVRHAQTTYNRDRIMQGQVNSELSELGKKQAKLLGERLAKMKIDIIYSSPLKRCKDTIEPLLKKKKIPVVFRDEIIERSFGELDGISYEKYREAVGQKTWKDFDFKPPRGESYNDVIKRTKVFLDEILKKDKGKTVLIVVHGGSKRALLMNLFDRVDVEYFDETREISKNTAVTIVNLRDDLPHHIESFYSVEHLEDLDEN